MHIESVTIAAETELQVNQPFQVTTRLHTGDLTHHDIEVELYQGSVGVDGEIHGGEATAMAYRGQDDQGRHCYGVDLTYTHSGLQGLSLRILPKHEYLSSSLDPKVLLWANPEEVAIEVTSEFSEPITARSEVRTH